jgi:hypothetical protein
MERELKKAAKLIGITKENINFGLIQISQPSDLKFDLKVEKFPAIVAIK